MSNNPYSNNPYNSPQKNVSPYAPTKYGSGRPDPNPLKRLRPVAICLIVVTIIGFANIFGGIILRVTMGLMTFDLNDPRFIGNIFGLVIISAIHLAMLLGAINMIRGVSYSSCYTAAVLACIPICSPVLILGIPFGIWAIVVLNQSDVKSAFQ
ncbi:MAG: hypothetical protein AAFN77_13230 [Planctomycetota bacterium]